MNEKRLPEEIRKAIIAEKLSSIFYPDSKEEKKVINTEEILKNISKHDFTKEFDIVKPITQVLNDINNGEVYKSLSKNIIITKKEGQISIDNPKHEDIGCALFKIEEDEYKLFSKKLKNKIDKEPNTKFKIKLDEAIFYRQLSVNSIPTDVLRLINKTGKLEAILDAIYYCCRDDRKKFDALMDSIILVRI